MQGTYEIPLVLASIVVAIVASYTALSMAGRIASAKTRQARWWILGGAFAMGTGVWAMHFIGMLAFRLPIPLAYDLGITVFSFLLPVAASGVALWMVRQPTLSTGSLAGGALLVGGGINGMHYSGMAAMRIRPAIEFDPVLVAASLVIAVGAAGAALLIALRSRADTPRAWAWRGIAAVAMGVAIVGMHYTGMAAAHFPPGSICTATGVGLSNDNLAVLVIVASLAVLSVAILTSVYDGRLEARSRFLALSQALAEERQVLLLRERTAREEAEQISKMKDEFLSTLSHELRTPLNAILGWAQLLKVAPRDESRLRQGMETIERNALAQAKLIEDLLDMNRIMSGKVRLDIQNVDVLALVAETLESIRPAALAKNIRLVHPAGPAVGEVPADPSRLQQVLWNLLSNAVKFTSGGGEVSVSVARRDACVEITVSDTGIGISTDFLPHLFERFRQADASISRRYGGLGLGLSIVKQLVELHGGTIEAISEGERMGSAFVVRLPAGNRHAAAAAAAEQGVTLPDATAGFRPVLLRGIKVLVVDDEADARTLLQTMLQDCDAQVRTGRNAEEALELLKRESPDVLVCDIGMPGMSGFELIARIRTLPPPAGTVLAIALTAFTRREDEARALACGFTAFLSKPVRVAELASQVAELGGGRMKAADGQQAGSARRLR